jgi:hypothetical protein
LLNFLFFCFDSLAYPKNKWLKPSIGLLRVAKSYYVTKLIKGVGQPEVLIGQRAIAEMSAELDRHGLIESINKRYA